MKNIERDMGGTPALQRGAEAGAAAAAAEHGSSAHPYTGGTFRAHSFARTKQGTRFPGLSITVSQPPSKALEVSHGRADRERARSPDPGCFFFELMAVVPQERMP